MTEFSEKINKCAEWSLGALQDMEIEFYAEMSMDYIEDVSEYEIALANTYDVFYNSGELELAAAVIISGQDFIKAVVNQEFYHKRRNEE